MLTVISLDNKEYTAISNVPRVQKVNGEREITLSFLHGDINDEFLSDIETGWKANFKGDIYHLFNEKEDKHGNKEFDAVLDFFHHFNGRWHVDEEENKSMTINDSIRPLFDGSDYVLSIIDNFYANTMSYSKQQNSTERFLYFIGRHKAEFNIPIGTKTVQIRNKIGVQRNDVLIHEDDNLIDFNINTDTGSFCTAIRYYYDFKATGDSEESTEKEPTKNDVYISPMASKYGVHYGEPIYDERFSVKANAEQAAKEKQESTWQSSFEIGAELFETPLGIGDEIPFVVPSKGINGYIRVVEINETFDEDGELIEATYTFGNENIASQYRKMQYDALQDVHDILNGRKPIPYSVLPKAVREATSIINAGDSTQFYYQEDGIYGFNKDNPNWSVRMNANGLGYSVDGGQNYNNAITHLGVVTEALTAGTIDANRVTIYGDKQTKRVEINGDRIKVWDSSNPDKFTEITPTRTYHKQGHVLIETKTGRRSIIDGMLNRSSTMTSREPAFISSDISIEGSWFRSSSTQYVTAHLEHYIHEARWLMVSVALNSWGYDDVVDARMETTSGKVSNYFSTENLGSGTHYGWLRIDLGEPLDRPTTGSVRIMFKSRRGNQVRMHIANRFLTDFPDNL